MCVLLGTIPLMMDARNATLTLVVCRVEKSFSNAQPMEELLVRLEILFVELFTKERSSMEPKPLSLYPHLPIITITGHRQATFFLN